MAGYPPQPGSGNQPKPPYGQPNNYPQQPQYGQGQYQPQQQPQQYPQQYQQQPYGQQQYYPQQQAPGIPGTVIAGFILSFLCPLIGLILCAVGMGEAKRRNAGVGLATAGIIIAICMMIVGVYFRLGSLDF
jgi:hypothetical protein